MRELLEEMHAWMSAYMKSFYTEDAEVQNGIEKKEKHTEMVMCHCMDLARNLKLSEHDCQLAEMIGLFHDVGRFRQYTIYRTFNDALSEDHAELGLKVLSEQSFVDKLPAEDKEILYFAISNHNKKEITPTEDERKLLLARIIRDADKLDIYRVLEPFLTGDTMEKAPNFIQGIAGQEISPDFMELFAAGQQADYHRIRTHGDRKLVRLLWVYDISFAWTMQRIVEKGYLDKIMASLSPVNEKLQMGIDKLWEHVRRKCSE